ncbi:hypothetical protein [Glutamicibacter sp. NPDC087673]
MNIKQHQMTSKFIQGSDSGVSPTANIRAAALFGSVIGHYQCGNPVDI